MYTKTNVTAFLVTSFYLLVTATKCFLIEFGTARDNFFISEYGHSYSGQVEMFSKDVHRYSFIFISFFSLLTTFFLTSFSCFLMLFCLFVLLSFLAMFLVYFSTYVSGIRYVFLKKRLHKRIFLVRRVMSFFCPYLFFPRGWRLGKTANFR